MNLAPIVLFVYNRLQHTEKTLAALKKNRLATQSDLFIYADGPKNETQFESVQKVRTLLDHVDGFKSVEVIKREKNYGLANSIINGVTDIINRYGKVIVLEDDIITGKGFLTYMNEALDIYNDEKQVGCIHAWNYKLNTGNTTDTTFFLRGADCWGWGTWQRAWNFFNKDGSRLLKNIISKNLSYEFNRRNTHDFINMLQQQIDGKNDSWAVRWHASLFVNDMYCLHPVKSLVENTGLDASGTHCGIENIEQEMTQQINIKRIPVEESEWFFKAYKQKLKCDISKWEKLKASLKQLLPQ